MTREQKIEAFTRRLDGETFQSIADSFGVSRQYIETMLKWNPNGRRRRESNADKCVYRGLSEYIRKNEMTIRKFAEIIGCTESYASRKLSGEIRLHMDEIEKILAKTGMTFEECFARKS